MFYFYEIDKIVFNHIQLEEYKQFNPVTQLTITTTGSVVPFYVCIFHFSTIWPSQKFEKNSENKIGTIYIDRS